MTWHDMSYLIHEFNYLELLIKHRFHYSLAGLAAKQHTGGSC